MRRFSVGEVVTWIPDLLLRSESHGDYRIVAVMPDRDDDHMYRIKSPLEEYERVVKEDLLVKSTGYLPEEAPARVSRHSSSRIGGPHSITSSARASSVAGTSRPIALAALRLMTSSTFAQSLPERSKSPRTPKPQHPLSAMSYCHMSFDWCSARGLISYDARFGVKMRRTHVEHIWSALAPKRP